MSDSSWLTSIGLIAILAASPPLLAGDTLFGRGSNVFCLETSWNAYHDAWRLGVANGELVFWARRRGDQTEARTPSVPLHDKLTLQSSSFVKDGAWIRVRAESKQIEKGDWYLTGDYSTKPPRIILTKELTKYSRWTWVEAPLSSDPEEGINRYIKNDNDQGKDVWLGIEDNGVQYEGGWEVRRPTLSFEKKTLYYVSNQFSGK